MYRDTSFVQCFDTRQQVVRGRYVGRIGKVIKCNSIGWFDVVFGSSAKVCKVRKCDFKCSVQAESSPSVTSSRKASLSSKTNAVKHEPQPRRDVDGRSLDHITVNHGTDNPHEYRLFQAIDAMDVEDQW
jgi:hypothetical protein